MIRMVTTIKPDAEPGLDETLRARDVVEYEVYDGEVLKWRRIVAIRNGNILERQRTAHEQEAFAQDLVEACKVPLVHVARFPETYGRQTYPTP